VIIPYASKFYAFEPSATARLTIPIHCQPEGPDLLAPPAFWDKSLTFSEQFTVGLRSRAAAKPHLSHQAWTRKAVEKPTFYAYQSMYLMSSTSFPFSP
jgi:hypothetical protein